MTEATRDPGATGMNVDPTTLLGGGASIGRQLLVTTIAILLGLLVGAVLIILSGVIGPAHTLDLTLPITAYGAMLEGALGGPKAIANTLNAATPLIFAGLAVAFGFRAGLFNIGANGQFLIGAFFAAIVGHAIGLPFPIAVAICHLRRRPRRCRVGLHPRRPQGVAGCPRGGHHDHAQQHRLPAPEPPGEQHLQGPDGDVPANARHQPGRCPADHPRRHPPARRHHRWRCSPRSPSGSCCSRRRWASRSEPWARMPAPHATPASGRRSSSSSP